MLGLLLLWFLFLFLFLNYNRMNPILPRLRGCAQPRAFFAELEHAMAPPF